MTAANGGIAATDVDRARIVRARMELGCALQSEINRRADELLADTGLPERVREAFDRAARTSTPAVARWIAGGGIVAAREAGIRTTAALGELSARLDAPLPLVTKQVLIWRDWLELELTRQAKCAGSPPAALDEAVAMVRRSADFTLVGIAKAFEHERQRAAATLTNQRQQLQQQATRDALTGLANRSLVLEQLDAALDSTGEVAVVIFDLDKFRYINDGHGYHVGDDLLREIADRLSALVSPLHTLGRLSGDEFVVVIPDSTVTPINRVVARLRDAIARPTLINAHLGPGLRVTASVGVAKGFAGNATEFIRRAEIAMYVAKSRGRDQVVTYHPAMDADAIARLDMEQALRLAADRDEFVVWYQPIFDLTDMRIVGAEALLRWEHPTSGLVGPGDFIPLLEDTGLVVEVGRYALRRSCADFAALRSAGHEIGVTVNVSPVQLRHTGFGTEVLYALRDVGLPTSALTIEITEEEVMSNAEHVISTLRMLRNTGVRVALDDFGTGYSSLSQLGALPIDILKIDKSFVERMVTDVRGEAFIEVISALARAVSLTTIAEGIESLAQMDGLRKHGFAYGQGYLLGAPMPCDALAALLRDRSGDVRGAPPSPSAGP